MRLLVACVAAAAWCACLAAPADAFVYWTTTGTSIGRANLDGSGVDPSFLSTAASALSLHVDQSGLYWGNYGNGVATSGTVGHADLNGAGASQSFIAPAYRPCGVAVIGRYIYWSNCANHTISRANLDGTGVIGAFITSPDNAANLVVAGQYIYWAGANAIGRARLDGTNVQPTLIRVSALGLAADGSHLYWSSSGPPVRIGRANLDGSGVNRNFINPRTVALEGVAVDAAHIYWSNDQDAIGRANLNGSGVTPRFILTQGQPFAVAVDSGQPPNLTNDGIEQVVFVHGINASCAVAGASDYRAMYDALVSQGIGVYTFCYDHDIGFGSRACTKAPGGSGCHTAANGSCFSATSRGEAPPLAFTAGPRRPTAGSIGPLPVTQDKPLVRPTFDGDSALAYDAGKLDDCLTQLINYDIHTYGSPDPIAVVGNSMGGAITRGWLQLAKSEHGIALDGVTTTMFLEGAVQGSWIAALGEGLDLGLQLGGPEGAMVDQFARLAAGYLAYANPGRAGVQDLVPQSNWYRAVASSGPPPRMHYFAFSADMLVHLYQQLLFWTVHIADTDALGDGVMQLGSAGGGWNALSPWGGSLFSPFGSGPDQHQFVVTRNFNETFVGTLPLSLSNPYGDPYNHFNFGTYMGMANGGGLTVPSCALLRGVVPIPLEIERIIANPSQACGPHYAADAPSAADVQGAASFQPVPAPAAVARAASGAPVEFRDRGGHVALSLYTSGALRGRFTLRTATGHLYYGTLPGRLARARLIRLDAVIHARSFGSRAPATVRLHWRGLLRPGTRYARLTITGGRPRVTRLDSATPDLRAARNAATRVIRLAAHDDLLGLAKMLAPSELAGKKPGAIAAQLRAANVQVLSVTTRGRGRSIWLPDGDPGWTQPITATAAGWPPVKATLVLEQSHGVWRVLGTS